MGCLPSSPQTWSYQRLELLHLHRTLTPTIPGQLPNLDVLLETLRQGIWHCRAGHWLMK